MGFIDPSGVGTDNWTKSAGTAATCLDDGVRSPTNARTSGDGNNITSQTDEQVSDLVFPNTLTYAAGEALTLWLYGSGGTRRAVDVQISNDDGGTWQTRQLNVIGAAAAAGWYSLDISSWVSSQTHLDQLRARLICNSTAGGGATNAQIDAAYVQQVVTYSTGASLPITGSLSGAGVVIKVTGAALSVAASLSGAGVVTRATGAALNITGSLTGTGQATRFAGASLSASTSLSATGVRTAVGQASLAMAAVITGVGTRQVTAGATLPMTSSLSATGLLTHVTGALTDVAVSLTATPREKILPKEAPSLNALAPAAGLLTLAVEAVAAALASEPTAQAVPAAPAGGGLEAEPGSLDLADDATATDLADDVTAGDLDG